MSAKPLRTPDDQDDKTDPGIVLPARPPAGRPPIAPGQKMPELGPITALMKDPEITEIMINDLRNVMIERGGKAMYSGFAIASIDELNRLVRNILDTTGRVLSPDQPYVDVILADGSRVNIVGPPLTLAGPCVTIRKFPERRLSMDELTQLGMLDAKMAYFLRACVVGRMNIVVSGGTDSGKTTFLNALCAFIPKAERVITIEDTPEIALSHANSVKLQTKPQMPASAPVTARDLVANALRMRPDRIIVGECRRAEAFDMLQAMNTGHAGSMTTIHANSPRDALSRIETLSLLAGVELPLLAIRKQMNSAIDLVVQLKRFRNGRRRVTAITEVTGVEGDTITLQDIYLYATDPKNAAKSDAGRFKCTGFTPIFLERLADQGIELPKDYFAD